MPERLPSQAARGKGEPIPEDLDPNHVYIDYIYHDPKKRQRDITTLVEQARQSGYRVRYWWQSDDDRVDIPETADFLILCVHMTEAELMRGLMEEAGLAEDAGPAPDVTWDSMGVGDFDDYRRFGTPITTSLDICDQYGRPLFAPREDEPVMPLTQGDTPTIAQATGKERAGPHAEPFAREDDPLWALTVGDVQEVALDQVGRFLTEAEVKAVMKMVLVSLNVTPLLQEAMGVCQKYGTVGQVAEEPAADTPALHPPDEGPLPEPIVPGDAVPTSFLVYYALGGMMLVHAADATVASESAFASLHRLIGRAEVTGVTPRDASQVRLGDLDITVESAEAIGFPLGET